MLLGDKIDLHLERSNLNALQINSEKLYEKSHVFIFILEISNL